MQIAMVAANFSPGEADQLRRSMAAWKKRGGLEPFRQRLRDGMRKNGYPDAFAQRIFEQIKGFGSYGFPESHAASFALLTYVSCWLKCHEPAAFLCALLNSQPLGFYGPSQLVQDARRHGVEVRPVDIHHSVWESRLERQATGEQPAVRLGMDRVKGLRKAAAERIVAERRNAPFRSLADVVERCRLQREDMEVLAAADALRRLAGHRHLAHWDVAGLQRPTPLLGSPRFSEATPLLRTPTAVEEITGDYNTTALSLKRHPLALLRDRLVSLGVCTAQELWNRRSGSVAQVAGLVTNRQRPGTASGVIFVTLEDETGFANLIVWPNIAKAQRIPLLASRLMLVSGIVQKEENVLHLVAGKIRDCSHWLQDLQAKSRDFQ